ncbi:isopenicillin N synthase family dioxygenase [Gordonia sp. NPDC003376]
MARTVPIIDLTPFRSNTDTQGVVDKVRAACTNTGFLVVTGHGVPTELVTAATAAAREFFDSPTDVKRSYRNPGRGSGYEEFANMSLGQSQGDLAPADLREGYTARRVDIIDWRSPVWGASEPDTALRETISNYYCAMDQLADTIMEVFALALDRPRDFFRAFTDRHDSQVALYHYPPMSREPLPGQLRGGAHTDFGSLTLLHGDPSVHGLEVWNGTEWDAAPIVADSFVVNIGDLMQRWTNDTWKSTVHRVANPADGDWDKTRYTIAFFHQPNHDAEITSLDPVHPAKYPTVTSGAHFTMKLEAMALT